MRLTISKNCLVILVCSPLVHTSTLMRCLAIQITWLQNKLLYNYCIHVSVITVFCPIENCCSAHCNFS